MIYFFIKNNEGLFPIDKMCKVLEVGLNSHYCWKWSSTSYEALRKERLKELITNVYFEFKQRCCNPRISDELQSSGYKISLITVAKHIKEMGIRSKLAKKFKVTTDSKHNYLIMDNILNSQFEQKGSS